jgi:Fe-S-cluster containining protein
MKNINAAVKVSKRARNKNRKDRNNKGAPVSFTPPPTFTLPKAISDPIVVSNEIEASVVREIESAVGYRSHPEAVKKFIRAALPSISRSIKLFFIAKTVGQGLGRRENLKSFYRIADKLVANELSQSKTTPACGAGCNHCCRNMHITFCEDEAAQIAEAVSGLDEDERRKVINRLFRLNATGSGVSGGQCALLDDDGKCSIYENRPITCRTYHSTSAEKCRDKLTKGLDITDCVAAPYPFDSGILHSFWTMLGVRRSQYVYEMNQFLKRLLLYKDRLDGWSSDGLIDEADIAVYTPTSPNEIQRRSIPLLLIEDISNSLAPIKQKRSLLSFLRSLISTDIR